MDLVYRTMVLGTDAEYKRALDREYGEFSEAEQADYDRRHPVTVTILRAADIEKMRRRQSGK